MNAPGMSVTAMYLRSLASMVHDSSITSSYTVGELLSDFDKKLLCDQLCKYPLALILLSLFSSRTLNTRVLSFLLCATCFLF